MTPFRFWHHGVFNASSSFSVFLGAFGGAFFAFIFGLLTIYLTKKREQFIRHKNALVKLERLLNEHSDELHIAKGQAEVTKKILGEKGLTDYRFNIIKLDSQISLELASIDVVNDYFTYSRVISRLNTDFAAKNHALTRFEDVKIAGQKLEQESVDYMIFSMGEIFTALDSVDTRMIRLLSKVRIYLQKINNCNPTFYFMFHEWDVPISDDELKAEIAKLEGEMKQSQTNKK